jgi:hypothetical protein
LLADKADKREKGLLQFNIPTESGRGVDNMRTFIKVTLQSTDDKEPITLGEFPKLPQKAPNLSRKNIKTISALKETAIPDSKLTEEEND